MSASMPKLGIIEGTTAALATALKPGIELQPYRGSTSAAGGQQQ
jgi:hypothetical protein